MRDDQAFFLYFTFLMMGLVPMIRHVVVFQKLEKSLIDRLGPIWGENQYQRTFTFSSSGAIPNLDLIEKNYGSQLTELECKLAQTSRRLYYFGRAWVLAVFSLFLLFVILRG